MTNPVQQSIPSPTTPMVMPDGRPTEMWRRFLHSLWLRTGSGAGALFAPHNGDASQTFEVGGALDVNHAVPLVQVEAFDANTLNAALAEIKQGTGAPFVTETARASPYTFQAPGVGHLVMAGGALSALTLTRGTSTASIPVGIGMVPMDYQDSLQITYSSAPTLTWIPR